MNQKQLEISFDLQKIVFDQLDSQKFVLIGKNPLNENGYLVIEGHLRNGFIFVNKNVTMRLVRKFFDLVRWNKFFNDLMKNS